VSDFENELLDHIREIRKLLELLAEPAIAQRDAKLRQELRQIVGSGKQKQRAVMLMNGTRRRTEIQAQSPMGAGNLSTLIARLTQAKLVADDAKLPRLTLSLPANFFESAAENE
jgi:hypothetical protein